MKSLKLLEEYVRRGVRKTLAVKSLSKETKDINRLVFLKNLQDTEGKYLFKFIEPKLGAKPIKSKDVTKHIMNKVETTFSTVQLSYIRACLEGIGFKVKRKADTEYFIDVVLK